jgi:hypothetical protein
MDLRGGLLINGQPGVSGQTPTRQPDGSLAWQSFVAPVQSVALSGPVGWSTQVVSTSGNVTLTFALPSGQTLLALADKTSWDAAAALAATAVQPTALTTALSTKADLIGGVIPSSQIPAIAISDYLGAVASQAAMLALTGQRGDWCLRTDSPPAAGMWVLSEDNAALLSSWVQIPVPAAPVQSINNQTGVVTLGTGDIQETGGYLYFTASRAIEAALTGFTALAGTVAATDSILQAIQKIVGNIANSALSGLIGSSNLTINPNRLAGRITTGVGAVEEITPAGGMVLINGNLVPGEIVKLVVSSVGETGITTGNVKSEVRIDRAFTLLGVWWSCNPTAMGTAGTSDARPYIRTGADTASVGTKTNILTGASSITSLSASVHTVDATSSINGGTISGSPGDWLGVDLMSVGTGSSGHFLTFILRY